MNIAILSISSLSLIASVSTLVIMYKTSKKLDAAGQNLKTEVDNVKSNTNAAIRGMRSALDGIEL